MKPNSTNNMKPPNCYYPVSLENTFVDSEGQSLETPEFKRRAVECVNACEKLDNPVVEIKKMRFHAEVALGHLEATWQLLQALAAQDLKDHEFAEVIRFRCETTAKKIEELKAAGYESRPYNQPLDYWTRRL